MKRKTGYNSRFAKAGLKFVGKLCVKMIDKTI
jgi:hypothetical protein